MAICTKRFAIENVTGIRFYETPCMYTMSQNYR